MSKEFEIKKVTETIIYYEGVPEQVVENLSEDQQIQYFIWDEMIKRMARLYPQFLLPVIKEVFGREYQEGVGIEFLSTEYSVDTDKRKGVKVLHSIYADLVVEIDNKDIYHLECQIIPEHDITIRMFEYDSQIALVHGVGIHKEKEEVFLEMPNSIILYLTHTANTPDYEKLQIRLPNEKKWEYLIPTLKVQNYDLEMIQKKRLFFLIPLTIIRYYSRKTKQVIKNTELSLQQFLIENIRIVREAVRDGDLDERAGKDILDFMNRSCQYLFARDGETMEAVRQIMEPIFKLGREIFEEEATERITLEVTEKITRQVTEDVTRQVTEDVTRQVTEDVTRQVTEDVTRQVTEDVTQQITERDIKEFIVIEHEEGTEKAVIKRKLMRIFNILEEAADEKMKLYY